MSNRINVTIKNATSQDLKCTNLSCATLDGLSVGDVIIEGKSKSYTASSNDRIFVQFTGDNSVVYNLAMTCPELSDNSATGFGNGGLQQYSGSGTPANFIFRLGEGDKACWSSGKSVSFGPRYGDCS